MTTKFKSLYLFVIASNSLLLTGSIVNHSLDTVQLLILQWCGLCGVFIIYRFNDFIDQTHDFKFNLQRLLTTKIHVLFLLHFFLLVIPSVFVFLSPFRIASLSTICTLGILYSINFRINEKNLRLKNIFIVKNLFIGILWGSLILVGANGWPNTFIIGLFVFTTIQVFIGSIIRDIPDYELDKTNKVNSFPVIFGTRKTILLLHTLNILSFVGGYCVEQKKEFLFLMGITVTWRLILLVVIPGHINSRFWTQTINLLTCSLIFVISLMEISYALF